MYKNSPRIVIGGTNSGCGKTTFTIGLLYALQQRGLEVCPYKVGPDYLDPLLHQAVTGKMGNNLDAYLLGEEGVEQIFLKYSRMGFSVIEGVMGLFDGMGRSRLASTAHVAVLLHAPVLLLMDVKGMSLSAAALLQGFVSFDKSVAICGVVLNNVRTQAQYTHLKQILEENTNIEVLGYMPTKNDFFIESRHLGLKAAGKMQAIRNIAEKVAKCMEETININRIVAIACACTPLYEKQAEHTIVKARSSFRIGIALDEAFHFYYQANLEYLKEQGAQLCFFSPMHDSGIPADLQGLYIGGGYPEVYGEMLQQNSAMRNEIKWHAEQGMPIFGECGGYMYLCNSLYVNGNTYRMAGILDETCKMGDRLVHFGYTTMEALEDTPLCKKGMCVRAHEFHYSFELSKKAGSFLMRKNDISWTGGRAYKNTVGFYPHIHFLSNPAFIAYFIELCRVYRKER